MILISVHLIVTDTEQLWQWQENFCKMPDAYHLYISYFIFGTCAPLHC